jgi:hypothetical protein
MRLWTISCVGAFLLAAPAWAQQELPDRTRTPGVPNPNVTSANIRETICVQGWTRTIRPPTSYTNNLKRRQIAEYGFSDTNLADYEEDHLISLELGGHPRDPKNLWPQSYKLDPWNARIKDQLENFLSAEVCAGRMPLQRAQQEIASDWIAAYKKYLGTP